MWENQSPVSKKIGGVALMALGAVLLIFGALWVLSLVVAAAALWLINYGMVLWGGPSLWFYAQRMINTIRQNLA